MFREETAQHFEGRYIVVDNTDDVGGQLRVDSEMDGAIAICGVRNKDEDGVMAELHANARRIASCLNVCDGIATDLLEHPNAAKVIQAALRNLA